MRKLVFLVVPGCSFLDPAVGERIDRSADAAPLMTEEKDVYLTDASDADPDAVIFKRDIRPLINRSPDDPTGHGCRNCHFPNEGLHIGYDTTGLDLSTLGGLRNGGSRTRSDILLPGDPAHSAVVLKLRGTYDGGKRMPRDGPPYWTDKEIGLVEAWIAQGAKGDNSE